MVSGPNERGRRIILPSQERSRLRSALFRLYGREPDYRSLVVTVLRPMWHAVPRKPDDRWASFTFVAERARLSGADHSLRGYVSAIERHVEETLRLTEDGQPAAWAAMTLHGAVAHTRDLADETVFDLAPTWD